MSYPNPYQAASEGFSSGGPETLKHSGLGIASFLVGLVAGLLEVTCLVIIGILQATNPRLIDDSTSLLLLIGFAILSGVPLGLLGIGLGFAGLCQRRKKLFAVMGVVISSLVVAGVAAMLVLGMTAGN